MMTVFDPLGIQSNSHTESDLVNMKASILHRTAIVILLATGLLAQLQCQAAEGNDAVTSYDELRTGFSSPDHAKWGEVPLWWWEGDPMTRERVTWQLETLAAAGVKSICPIQRSPGRCDPASFSPEWWDMFEFVHQECERLGMSLWAYDQVGYGHYGWLEKAAARAQDPGTKRVEFLTAESTSGTPIRMELPAGEILGARAYSLVDGIAQDDLSIDLVESKSVSNQLLQWTPPAASADSWRVAVSVAIPDQAFQLSPSAGDVFIDMFYAEIERRLGADAMGSSFAGVFQDEHPPTPRDVYTLELAEIFWNRFGYDIARAIPALHFDVGQRTPKYRTDFFDAYLQVDEQSYWKRVYDWTADRGLLTSHDNWGRNNIVRQSQGYIDYFRTQRWFSAPGYDDWGLAPVTSRNYYDTKIASSIARLYDRPRVWSEAFHSSGWGRTTDQTLSWLSANYVFGANLYDEHGLYYSTRASTWEHAAPDPHWRQPYWRYYKTLSDWIARTSYIMSQGRHVVDAAVHYPVVSLLAGEAPGQAAPDYNFYMQLSRKLFDAAIDNDIIDDDSILAATVENGRLIVGGNWYQALVFPPEITMRRSVLEKALALAESGGVVIFTGSAPVASAEAGRQDPELQQMIERAFGGSPSGETIRRTAGGGLVALLPSPLGRLAELVSQNIDRDFIPQQEGVYVSHRKIGEVDVYMVQNPTDQPLDLEALCRVDGVPEVWDPFTGEVSPVEKFERTKAGTVLEHRLEGNVAHLFVFRPGEQRKGISPSHLLQPDGLEIALAPDWEFSLIPTRDNRWGEFRWPPSNESIGAEMRSFRYREASSADGMDAGWQREDFDDTGWSTARFSIGPYWLCLPNLPAGDEAVRATVLDHQPEVSNGGIVTVSDRSFAWQTVEFSKSIGRAEPAPWGGHSGYPDGAIDQNFINLPEGRKLLFTRIRSPKAQRLGLRVELRNSSARLWVNGAEQPFEDAIGNLPLVEGVNQVLLDLPDGSYGMLYVQEQPPAVQSMADAARGMVKPELQSANWIRGADPSEAWLRKSFELEEIPADARLVVTGYTGYRLVINGVLINEEIGPWARWTHPESFNVTRHLRRGKNVIAAWTQVHAGQNVGGEADKKALALAMKMRFPDGRETAILTDDSWLASDSESAGWDRTEFDDSTWPNAIILGRMGEAPWGNAPLDNLGAVTEPHRALSVDLPSPYLTCFDEVPDIVYDVKEGDDPRIGWFRFDAPPGLKSLTLHTTAPARLWVDGREVPVQNGVAVLDNPPTRMSQVALRLEMLPGEYGGAAFPLPPSLELEGGLIQTGLWADFGLPTYSGIGVYEQTVQLTEEQMGRRTVLDLGQVLVAAEVLVNGQSAGVRLANPFKFDISQWLKPGDNRIEIRVANTIAPHYTVTNRSENLGVTDSGLLGPVTLKQELQVARWKEWAEKEITRLDQVLATTTDEIRADQREWEEDGQWEILRPVSSDAAGQDGWIERGTFLGKDESPLTFRTDKSSITGFRIESRFDDANAGAIGEENGTGLMEFSMVANPAEDRPYLGRYVRIDIPGRTEYLHLAEVEVFSGSDNIALQGRARQSSQFDDAAADRAIDGNTNGNWSGNSVCHTHSEPSPWWEVDLGDARPINRIVVHNRTDGGLESRLQGYRVTVLDGERQVIWQQDDLPPATPRSEFYLLPVPVQMERVATKNYESGRYIVELMQNAHPTGFAGGTILEIQARPKSENRTPATVRISATSVEPAIYDIPESIAATAAKPPAERTQEEAAAISAFYRSVAPALEPARQRREQLKSQLEAFPPNIVVILCDDLGYGDLQCYGHPYIQTPNLNRMAEEGIRFTQFYSASPVCSPSRTGLLTGRTPNRAGVYDWIPPTPASPDNFQQRFVTQMRASEITIPRLLKQAGYATCMSGKYHCNSAFNSPTQAQPGDHGFDHWFATQNNAAPSHANPVNYVRNGTPVGKIEGYSCQIAADEAISWLESHHASNPVQPFFLYLAFHEPHEPVASPPELVAKYENGGGARNHDEAEFFANVENVDIAVGRVLAAIDDLGISSDTLIVFTSDNGPETLNRYRGAERSYGRPGPLRGMKLHTHEAGYRVAGIMRWPGRIEPGQVSQTAVCSLDFLPTFCDLAKVDIPEDLRLDGANFLPALEGQPIEREQPLFWFYYNALNEAKVAMVDGDWKILAQLQDPQSPASRLPNLQHVNEANAERVRNAELMNFELYNLASDISEASDLSGSEPERLEIMRTKLEERYKDVRANQHIWPVVQPQTAP
jgi:arylsulfatase A